MEVPTVVILMVILGQTVHHSIDILSHKSPVVLVDKVLQLLIWVVLDDKRHGV